MFFLISGFVLYKSSVVWNVRQIVAFFRKKIPVQLLSPLLFFVVFMHVWTIDYRDGFFNDPKYGYWFTYVLFIYYVIYAVVRFIIRTNKSDIVLLVIGICLLPVGWPRLAEFIPVPVEILSFLSFQHWKYFLFFVLGTLLKKYYSQVIAIINGNWLLTICIVFYFMINAYKDVIPVHREIKAFFLTIAGLVILFSFFYKQQDLFSKKNRLGCTMQYMGRRTLDVYLIHHFLLPRNLTIVTVFKDHPMPVLEFAASSALAILIIALCLLVSNVIRLSPFLAHWLFGVKKAS